MATKHSPALAFLLIANVIKKYYQVNEERRLSVVLPAGVQ